MPPAIGEVLESLSLHAYKELFEKEAIDVDALLLFDKESIKELGLPLGPRLKLLK